MGDRYPRRLLLLMTQVTRSHVESLPQNVETQVNVKGRWSYRFLTTLFLFFRLHPVPLLRAEVQPGRS